MDNIDKFIMEDISRDIILPNSFCNTILNGLNKKEKIKQYRHRKIIKAIITSITSIILGTGTVFAGYNIYEKVWKEPIVYNNINEKIIDEKKDYEKANQKNLEKSEIISIENATTIFSNIFSNLKIEQDISEKNIKVNLESFSNYFEFENEQYKMILNANGIFQYFINHSFDYTIKNDDISKVEATQLSNEIIKNLGLDKQYILNNISNTVSFKYEQKANIWLAMYNQNLNGLKNKYNCIDISFNIVNGNIQIERIITLDNGFEFQNNEVVISKEEAIKIAKEIDRKISILDITSCDSELCIERLNSFVYIQEKTSGKEDEIKEEIIDGVGNLYNGYSNEKILRIVWKININYDYDKSNARNSLEYLGRDYYIDATTGEVIGGAWGKIED